MEAVHPNDATYPLKPPWYFIFLVSSEVKINDDHGEEGGESDEDHVQAEVGTCKIDQQSAINNHRSSRRGNERHLQALT